MIDEFPARRVDILAVVRGAGVSAAASSRASSAARATAASAPHHLGEPWFATISVASDVCLWTPRQRYANIDVAYHFHQIPEYAYEELRVSSDTHVLDPILDIIVVNGGDRPALLTGIGFEPLECWTDLKGIPGSGRVVLQDTYELRVSGFELNQSQLLKLSDPIFMEREAPYRFRIWLRDFTKEANGNETIVRLIARFAGQTVLSERIYLGLY